MKRKKHWKFLRLRSTAYALVKAKRLKSAIAAAKQRLQR